MVQFQIPFPRALSTSMLFSAMLFAGCTKERDRPHAVGSRQALPEFQVKFDAAKLDPEDKLLIAHFSKGPIDFGSVREKSDQDPKKAFEFVLRIAARELGNRMPRDAGEALDLAVKFNIPLGAILRNDKGYQFPATTELQIGDVIVISRRAAFLVGYLENIEALPSQALADERRVINDELSPFFESGAK
jgi:hypothetical protein